jgi:hypothetical protein
MPFQKEKREGTIVNEKPSRRLKLKKLITKVHNYCFKLVSRRKKEERVRKRNQCLGKAGLFLKARITR